MCCARNRLLRFFPAELEELEASALPAAARLGARWEIGVLSAAVSCWLPTRGLPMIGLLYTDVPLAPGASAARSASIVLI